MVQRAVTNKSVNQYKALSQ